MTKLAKIDQAKRTPAWRAQPHEPIEHHLAFLHWALQGGPLDSKLALQWDWAQRRATIETYEGLEQMPAEDQPVEAMLARVRITLAEIFKLQQRVMSTADNVMSVNEIMASIDWMIEAKQGYLERKAAVLDWSSLTPEEREIMIKAKKIQDRLKGD